MWHDRTIDLAAMFYYRAPFFTAVKRIIVQLEERLTQLLSNVNLCKKKKKQLLAVRIGDTRFPS